MSRRLVFFERYGLVAITGLIVAAFFVHPATRDTFATIANWRSIFGTMSIQILLAAAFTLPLITGKIDVSPGAIAVLCSMVFAGLIGSVEVPITGVLKLNWLMAGALVVITGAAIGAVNGLLVRAGADALIATLSTTIILGGLVSGYAQGRAIVADMPPQLLDFGRAAFGPFPLVFVAATVISIAVWFVLERTSFGRRLHAAGVNPLAARLIGVRVPETIFIAFVAGGAIAGFAAILATARQGGGVPVNGLNLVLPALAGTYLGATTIRPGEFNIPGTFVGLLFVSVTVSGLTLLGLPAWVQPVFSGSALIVAVLIAHWFQKLSAAQK